MPDFLFLYSMRTICLCILDDRPGPICLRAKGKDERGVGLGAGFLHVTCKSRSAIACITRSCAIYFSCKGKVEKCLICKVFDSLTIF
jgi:hypothetical protein